MEPLPIQDVRAELIESFRAPSARVMVSAPTGSGKSTRIPRFLLDDLDLRSGEITVLQPRRLAARMLASRVAEEMGQQVGETVGYEIRFERRVSPQTRIRFITEGVLLRQMIQDPGLASISCLLFDEFHERHLYGDLCLALVKQLQETRRPDLKLGVMSATLPPELLDEFLTPCRRVESEGRMYRVEIEYLEKPSSKPIWELAAEGWKFLADQSDDGHVLVFMPGRYEIERTLQEISKFRQSDDWEIHALHAELPPDKQDAAVRGPRNPSGKRRRVIVSTNVAETSLTIDGVSGVVDSGLARMSRFDPHRGFDALTIEKISQASAEQRAGRAGRTRAGICLRLWTRAEHEKRPASEKPEIQRVDLAEILLSLHGLGIEAPAQFNWLEPPLPASLERAELLLHDLGALEKMERSGASKLTPTGRAMLNFPVHPRFSRMLIEADKRGCIPPAARIAALSQGKPLLITKVDRTTRELREDLFGDSNTSDFFLELRAFEYARSRNFHPGRCRRLGIHIATARQVERLSERFLAVAEKAGLTVNRGKAPEDEVRKCILAGFVDQLGHRVDGGTLRCRLVHGRKGQIERESSVRGADFVVAAEITEVEASTGGLEVRMRRLTAIEPEWLKELFPAECRVSSETVFDESTRSVEGRSGRFFRGLELESRTQPADVDPAEAARLLAAKVIDGTCPLKRWDDYVESWIVRLNCLADWFPEGELPPIGMEERMSLIEHICLGATRYKEIKDREVLSVVQSWLSEPQQILLDQMVPERLKMPDNRRLKLRYQEGKPPILAAKIQHLYDVKKHPAIVDGRVPVLLEILAPNMRPIQVTSDLAGFWERTYPQIKGELARRYPKHEWR